jgi:hypothetical protein
MSVALDWVSLANAGFFAASLAACNLPAGASKASAPNRIPIYVAQGPSTTVTSISSNVVSLTVPDGQYLFQAKFLYLTDSKEPVPVSCNFPDGTRVAFFACSESNQILNPPIAYNSVDGYLSCAGSVQNGPVTITIECNVTEGLGSVTILRPVFTAIPVTFSVLR